MKHYPATGLEKAFWLLLGALLLASVVKGDAGFRLSPGAVAVFDSGSGQRHSFPVNLDARPWGPTGDGAHDQAAFLDRYFASGPRPAGVWPQGMAAENYVVNREALANWCKATHPEAWDCNPTKEEQYDLATTTSRRGDFYRQHWWAYQEGGSEATRIVITPENHLTYRAMHVAAVEAGVWNRGLIQLKSPVWGWPVYLDVQLPCSHEWMVGTPACGRAPIPDPEPDPPACEPLDESKFWRLCTERFEADLARCTAWAEDRPNSDLGRAWPIMCLEEPEPPVVVTCRVLDFRVVVRSTGQSTIEIREDREEPCDD